jgi:hypothetical protein
VLGVDRIPGQLRFESGVKMFGMGHPEAEWEGIEDPLQVCTVQA